MFCHKDSHYIFNCGKYIAQTHLLFLQSYINKYMSKFGLPNAKTASLSKFAASFGSNSNETRRVSCPRRLWVYGTANRSNCLAKDVIAMLKRNTMIIQLH